jgi:hypothetical protein
MAFKVRSWPECKTGLRQRGCLTIWIEDSVLNGSVILHAESGWPEEIRSAYDLAPDGRPGNAVHLV